MANADLILEQDEQEHEHLGGGRFNRLLGVVFVAVAMLGGVALALGVQISLYIPVSVACPWPRKLSVSTNLPPTVDRAMLPGMLNEVGA